MWLQEDTTRPASIEEIRRCLLAVLESKTFRQAPGLARLLQYLCSKAVVAEPQEITEYTIAVDVFGKPSDFKDSKDSTIRVEMHRLRKRLAQFYENEGADSRVRIAIAPGQYYPEFQIVEHARTEEQPPAAKDEALRTERLASEEGSAGSVIEPGGVDQPPPAMEISPATDSDGAAQIVDPPRADRRRAPLYGTRRMWLSICVAAGLLVLAAAVGIRNSGRRGAGADLQSHVRAQSPGSRPASSPATAPIRIIAGYSGPPHTDPSGFVWSADRYFEGGRPWQPPNHQAFLPRTNDPFLFQQYRSGEFSYHIPLPPGVYELHLYFVESRLSLEPGGGENLGSFSLDVNGTRVISSLDVDSNAMGPNIADELVLKDIQPASDGRLHLGFQSVTGVPFLCALEVLPGLPHKQLPIRLVAQERPFVDHLGQLWRPDNYFINGRAVRRDPSVAGSPHPGLFAGERFGHFNYALPIDVRGRYTVKLHFAEFYFGPQLLGRGGVGSRVFNVMCNGVLLLDDFDVFQEAGAMHAVVKTFHHLKPSAQGKLNLTFEPVTNYAVISAIEVEDES